MQNSSLQTAATKLLSAGHTKADIIDTLKQQGFDEFIISEVLTECIKLRNAKKRTNGLAYVLLGAIVCLGSCVLTLLSSGGQSYHFILFGLTSIGILFVFAGLVNIFG